VADEHRGSPPGEETRPPTTSPRTTSPRTTSPPTIRSVAAHAGVSKSLVSLVLQNSPRVSPERREAVLRAMDELGYRPDPVARSLAERRTRTVGVVVDDLRNPWFVDVLDGLRPVLHEHGLRPLLADGRTEPDVLRTLTDLRVDALLLVGTLPSAQAAGDLVAGTATVVAGSREPDLPHVDVVANDDEQGMRLAVRHLLELGHRRVAHVAGAGRVGRLRRDACVAALGAAGVDPVVVQADMSEGAGYRAAMELLRRRPRPTAVLAANDLSAVGVLAAADELGVRVPEEVSVVGYDDTSLARLRRVALTTVDNVSATVGRDAARRLLARRAEPDAPARLHLIVPRLVVRSTSGPAAAQ
jgi:DNA-binding LacI/PurR family transcriptional regulator